MATPRPTLEDAASGLRFEARSGGALAILDGDRLLVAQRVERAYREGGPVHAFGPAEWRREGDAMVAPREGSREWLVRGPGGVEHGIDLLSRPEGDGCVVVETHVQGLVPSVNPIACVEWRSPEGALEMVAHSFVVWDATGRLLPSWLGASRDHVTVTFDDTDATWPVTVDPVFSVPAASIDGYQTNGAFGRVVDATGDVNADGLSDVLVGARLEDVGGTDAGRAYLYLGGTLGQSTIPDWFVTGDPGDRLGASVGHAGDVNGDGYGDVLVGATGAATVFLFLGSAMGPSLTPSWTFTGGSADGLGTSLASLGDVNGDGFDDVALGEPDQDGGAGTDSGRVLVFHGSAAGLGSAPDLIIEGPAAERGFGGALATGDMDGDGRRDLLVGSTRGAICTSAGGRVAAFRAGAGGLDPTEWWGAEGDQAGECFAFSLAVAGDIDGDGFIDVAVGAPRHGDSAADVGLVRVYGGSAAGLSDAPAWTLEGAGAGEWFGASLGGMDLQGDGLADLVIGAPAATGLAIEGEAPPAAGRIAIHVGSPSGPRPVALDEVRAESEGAELGMSTSCGGDVNGDGHPDVVVGAWLQDVEGVAARGRIHVFLGSPTGLATSHPWTVAGHPGKWWVGGDIAAAGDVNGDGFDDVLVNFADDEASYQGAVELYFGSAVGLEDTPAWASRATRWTWCCYGWVSAAAGDVNGDGYDDFMVGSPDDTDAAGAVFLFLGSPSGPAASPSQVLESPDGDNADFGAALGHGDFNGDGLSDVLVGATGSGIGYSGHVSAYYGTASGLPSSPDWRASGSGGEVLGQSVASMDVNGDGFDDALVGAPGCGIPGRALVFLGGPSGLAPSATWSVTGTGFGEGFGCDVAGAGDLNGDGFDDFVVGSKAWTNGSPNEGRVSLYFGGAFAITAGPVLEGDETNVVASVARGIGDVDGDGYDDLLVIGGGHAPNRCNDVGVTVPRGPRAVVYRGDPSGVDRTPAWMARSESVTGFASACAPTGDVNGDGNPDFAVGAVGIGWRGIPGRFGRAFVYSGWGSGVIGARASECYEPGALDIRGGAVPLTLARDAAGAFTLRWEFTQNAVYSVNAVRLEDLRASGGRAAPVALACGLTSAAYTSSLESGNWTYLAGSSCAARPASLGRDSFQIERAPSACP